MKNITVAAIQMECKPGDRKHNLMVASRFVKEAADQGAQIILLPELMPSGYLLSEEIWDTAEAYDGESMAWLTSMAKQHGIYLGTSFLEHEGDEFYNSFILTNPEGEVAGRVRKSPPASVEAYFYRAGDDRHIIETELGKIGVTICYESLLFQYIKEFYDNDVDFILQPASAPSPMAKFPLRQKDVYAFENMLKNGAQFYARALGVPVVVANKAGNINTPMPGGLPELNSHFPGYSSIADSNGELKAQLDGKSQGPIVAEVNLNEKLKNKTPPIRYGKYWSMPVPWYNLIWRYTQWLGERYYKKSKQRKTIANEMSEARS